MAMPDPHHLHPDVVTLGGVALATLPVQDTFDRQTGRNVPTARRPLRTYAPAIGP